MANRYWVGIASQWDGTAGTKWATTSGGAGGAAVPTSADDVFLDASSSSCQLALGYNATCKSINCTGFTGTLNGTPSRVTVFGSITLVAGMTLAGSIPFAFGAAATFTTAGKTIHELGVGFNGAVTMADAVTATTLRVGAGSATSLLLKSGTTNTFTTVVDVSSAGNVVTLGATTTSAATISVASGSVSIVYASISYSTATGGATFTAGPGATNGGNNTGWTFLSDGAPLFELGAF